MTAPFEHEHEHDEGLEIAIVGMAGRFPGAETLEGFWRNLRDGVESVTSFTRDELRARGVPEALLQDPAFVKAGVVLDGFDRFDAEFFGYGPREAERIDPQQRLFLECAWHALENAGYDPRRTTGPVGVFGGDGANLYLLRHLLPGTDLGAGSNIADLLSLLGGNGSGSLCTRVAYKLNLRGPAVTVQTACSTSLTAVHLACQSLLALDCDMALAGGVWLNLLQSSGYLHQPGAILSPDGHCRAFDARAAGTLIGSGAGIVVLKRLTDALRDRDTVCAVIKASAINNDGAGKIGFTAPSVDGQAWAIRATHGLAGIEAASIGYIETHGTGTTLGDPIELAALTQAFGGPGALPVASCAIGSVKTNVGHLDAAAGVAGLIKTVLALQHRTLPPSLHFDSPNPQIDFAAGPFYVNTQAKPWPKTETPRRAGVSAFGIGGTNVHVVLEEAPEARSSTDAAPWCVLPLSARSPEALRQLQTALADHLEAHPEQALEDVAHTLQVGRQGFPYRSAHAVASREWAVEALRAGAPGVKAGTDPAPEVCFLFSGTGSQHLHMGAALYDSDPAFRADVDQCCELLARHDGLDLRPMMFPALRDEADAQARLERIENAQPAIFVVEYALARTWIRRGVRPAMMLGHSLGEYAAACIAGVFALPDALRIVAARSRLMATMAPGAMTAVPLPAAELAAQRPPGCDLAAVNAPGVTVLSGSVEDIEAAEETLREAGLQPRRLHVSVALHSKMTEPIMAALQAVVAAVERHSPTLPFISNVTGRPITAEEAVDPAYWARHLRSTVRFSDGAAHWLSVPGRAMLEVGPGEVLAGLARQQPQAAAAAGIWSSQAHPQQPVRHAQQMARAAAGLWCVGASIDWRAFPEARGRRRIPLPGYPFQRERCWIEAPQGPGSPRSAPPPPRSVADWFYAPSWQRAERVEAVPSGAEGCTLVFSARDAQSSQVVDQLQSSGRMVVVVEAGVAFAHPDERRFIVRPDQRDDHARVLQHIAAEVGPVRAVFHLWCLPDMGPAEALTSGFHALLAMAPALADAAAGSALPVVVVASGVADVLGVEPLSPAKATLLGACQVIGQEYPDLSCRAVDVAAWRDDLVAALATEPWLPAPHGLVAYRGTQRWLRCYEPVRRDEPRRQRLQPQGVYLITGGLGGVGSILARHLARAYGARLALLGRSELPPRAQWPALVDSAETAPALRDRLSGLLELEALGADVLVLTADVTDAAGMQRAVAQVRERWGGLQGVIHAAGWPGGGLIATRQRSDMEKVLAPKLAGSDHLLAAVRPLQPDFVLLCSSLTSVVGAFGQSDYTAANAYLDALAAEAVRHGGPWVLSVNWDTWRGVGLAAHHSIDDAVGIRADQGTDVLERLLGGPAVPQTVVSTLPLEEQVVQAQSMRLAERLLSTAAVPAVREQRRRPVLQSVYAAPATPLETDLAASWERFLGVTPVGADDNLFELGGDSLMAIQLIARVRKTYGVEVQPADFFKTPTVGVLAQLIETRLIEQIEQLDRNPAPAVV